MQDHDKTFLVSDSTSPVKTYKDLLKDLSTLETIPGLLTFDTPYNLFLNVIASLATGNPVTVFDSAVGNCNAPYCSITHTVDTSMFSTLNELYVTIESNKNKWYLSLFTSGTTGTPKMVTHSFASLNRYILTNCKMKDNVWGFCFNPSHIAGIQVLLQGFFNSNQIVYLFDKAPEDISYMIDKYRVTNLSMTSSFFASKILPLNCTHEFVKKVTFGGEKLNCTLLSKVNSIFPKSVVRNVYATTEFGTLFSSKSDVFCLKEDVKHTVKFGTDNELLVHSSMMGNSDNTKNDNEWYRTGDIVEFIDKDSFRIIGRRGDIVTTGGYQVNLNDVEEALLTMPGILQAVVSSKDSVVLGKILIAEVVLDKESGTISELEIHKYLEGKIHRWQIPRVVKFNDSIQLTRSGKKSRK